MTHVCPVVSAATLDFGSISPSASADTDVAADITVSCTNGQDYAIGLNDGANTARTMVGGAGGDTLDYELYTDSGRTTAWVDWDNAAPESGLSDGTDQTHTVYGRVPGGQITASAGTYTDTVTVTVSY